MFSIVMFSIDVVVFSLLHKHTGSISSVAADFLFPLFPTCHGLPAVIMCINGGMPLSATACVFINFLPFAYEVVRERF